MGLYIQNFNNYYQKNINMFITPSNFMKKKLIEYGINRNKVVHLDNFIKTDELQSSIKAKEKYILYFGRLAESKGIFELINVAKELPKIKVIFAGKFGETSDQNRANQIIKFKRIKNVKFVGFKNKVQLEKLISGCSFVVVPSKWNENQPYSVLESFALGKAVLASNVGGVPEIIQNDKNGLLFESGNMKDFKQKINKLWNDPAYVDKLGKNAKKLAFEKYNSEVHYKKLFTIYNDLIG
jgi:glycosyltransferase involved in cell wall biosynthesis